MKASTLIIEQIPTTAEYGVQVSSTDIVQEEEEKTPKINQNELVKLKG